uniref:Helitron helicase-like domain-containing protein n=1 Tax=Setaria italica TaxID=4555 RepID=K4AJJ9_SETIT
MAPDDDGPNILLDDEARRFPNEGPMFCCKSGKVHTYIPEVPYELRRFFGSQTYRDAMYFRKHIQYFNSHFSFASFGVSIDQRLATAKGSSVYCFKAHGQIYHKLDPLTPSGKGTRHMQLYFYDTDDSIDHRVKRRYNALAMEQVAAISVDGNDPQHRFSRSIVIYGKENDPHYIRVYHGCYDPLAYPLFFLGGETSWEDKKIEFRIPPLSKPKRKYTKRERRESGGSRRWVSAREYKCYKLQIREGQFNVFCHAGHLFQQLLVDWYVKVESMRLDWYSKPAHQALIRADLYQGLLDTLATGEANASKARLRIVLSKQFPGSDRDVQSRFMDALTLVTRYGKPDYFVTMTCNPYWDKIDHPDVVAWVYHAKLLDIHDFSIKKGHLGTVAAWAHVTTFQKRGLPHEHFLLVMESGSKLKSPDDYDKYISVEIPDPNKYPRLHELVVKHMMHGPCGTLNKSCPCMLLMRYNCHINVEICSSIKSVKYLYKYIYKGHDQTSFSVDPKGNERRVINEINKYRDARMITAIEAMQVHLPGFHMIAYKGTNNIQDVVDHAKSQRSMLTEYFKMNERSAKAHNYLNKEFPEYFTWNKSGKYWKPRVAKQRLHIGRLAYVNPNEGDKFYLRVLLN